jgi:hypothetical protein
MCFCVTCFVNATQPCAAVRCTFRLTLYLLYVILLQLVSDLLFVCVRVLPHFLDLLYTSADKDTVNTHLKTVLSHVWLHMKDYSSSGSGCHYLSVQLLARICQVEYTLKVWRKEAFECFTSKDFFSIGVNSLWRITTHN